MKRKITVSVVIGTIALAIIALSCQTHSQETRSELPPAAAPSRSSSTAATHFFNTVWMSVTPATAFVTYLFLRPDGSVGYSKTKTTSAFKYDGTDTWRIEEGHLIVVWSNGFATEKYPTDGVPTKVMNGVKTSKKWQGGRPVTLFRITDE